MATTIAADLLFILSPVELHIRDRFKLCPGPRLAAAANRGTRLDPIGRQSEHSERRNQASHSGSCSDNYAGPLSGFNAAALV